MSGPVDVLTVMDRLIGNARTMAGVTGDQRTRGNLREGEQARAAVAELIEAGKQLLPRSLCLNNPRWPDSTEIPLTSTLGELRAFAAALARVGGAK